AVGAVLTGVWASAAWNNPADPQSGARGLLEGNPGIVLEQVIGIVATCLYAGVVTWIILRILEALLGLRVPEDAEREGLDVSLHGEEAYHSGQGTTALSSLE